MNITTDNVIDLGEVNGSLTRNHPTFVVNVLQKKTPIGTKIGSKHSNYRTIEEARVCDSKD